MLHFGSCFSGIGGFDLGLERAGMKPAFQVEIDKFCNKVLTKHWPGVERYGDITQVEPRGLPAIDVLCGGFPCQDVSVAGKRAGLAGERSALFFKFAQIANALKPSWLFIENVQGLHSSNDGRDFFAVLDTLEQLNYGVATCLLDSQYFGVPQSRDRVFIVGHLGKPVPPQVLFEPESLSGDIAPRSGEGSAVRDTARIEAGIGVGGRVATIKGAAIGRKPENGPQYGEIRTDGLCYTLNTTEVHAVYLWENHQQDADIRIYEKVSPTLTSKMGTGGNNVPMFGVRKLTPVECERLQGFPDHWTCTCKGESCTSRSHKHCPDLARYKALGNAVTVPVIEWIGRRILAASQN